MLITRECDYAVRVLRAMAEEKRVSVNEICEKELITYFGLHAMVENRYYSDYTY